MRYLPVDPQEQQMRPYQPEQMPQMQVPQLDWSNHPANQQSTAMGGSENTVDWRKMFNPAKGDTAEDMPAEAGAESVGSMASEGAKGGGGAVKAIGSAISGF